MNKNPAMPRRRGRPHVKGLRERRQEQILEAATRIFARRGYPATDLQEVADALGVGKGTLYRYFPTKESLFLAAIERGIRGLARRVRALRDDVPDPLERIAAAIGVYLDHFSRHPDIVELMAQERAVFKNRKPTYFLFMQSRIGPWRDLLKKLMAQGRVRKMPVDRIIDVISDAIYGTIVTDYFVGRRRSSEVQTRDLLDIMFHGILTPASRKSLFSQETLS